MKFLFFFNAKSPTMSGIYGGVLLAIVLWEANLELGYRIALGMFAFFVVYADLRFDWRLARRADHINQCLKRGDDVRIVNVEIKLKAKAGSEDD